MTQLAHTERSKVEPGQVGMGVTAIPAVAVNGVTVCYRAYNLRPTTIKESILKFVKEGKIRHYSTFEALSQVSFSINPGEVVGFIGSNGAGKSTLLRVLLGVLAPSAGTVDVSGSRAALLRLGAGFDPELNAVENIFLNGALHKRTLAEMRERVPHILQFAELSDFAQTPIKYFSSGMYARLGFSVAIDGEPDILIVDEVLAVGDERFHQKCMGQFQRLISRGKTLIIVTHDLDMVSSLATKVGVLSKGKLVFLGDPKEAVRRYRSADYQTVLG